MMTNIYPRTTLTSLLKPVLTAVFLVIAMPILANEVEIAYPAIPEPVTSFGATVHKGKVYYYGGHFGQAHRYSTADQANTLWELDLNTKQWTNLSQGPRLQGLALVAYKDSLYRLGGFTAQNAPGDEHDLWSQRSFTRFNLKTKQWTVLPDLPEGRSSFDAVVSKQGILYVVGGWQMQGEKDAVWHQTAWTFNLRDRTAQWKAVANFPYRRRAVSIAPTKHGILVVGGMQDTGETTPRTAFYDRRTNEWSDGPSLIGKSELTGFGTASCNAGGKIIVSAYDGSIQTINSLGEFEVINTITDARFFHRLLPISDQQGLLIGGASMESGKYESLETFTLPTKRQPSLRSKGNK